MDVPPKVLQVYCCDSALRYPHSDFGLLVPDVFLKFPVDALLILEASLGRQSWTSIQTNEATVTAPGKDSSGEYGDDQRRFETCWGESKNVELDPTF